MREREIAALAACLGVARAKRACTEVEYAAAQGAKDTHAAAARIAGIAVDEAVDRWQGHMATRFDPLLSGQLARNVLSHQASALAAQASHEQASSARAQTAQQWRAQDASCRALGEQLAAMRRRAARARDERQLSALCDRVTFAWSVG